MEAGHWPDVRTEEKGGVEHMVLRFRSGQLDGCGHSEAMGKTLGAREWGGNS